MPVDRTSDFRNIVEETSKELPDVKRKRTRPPKRVQGTADNDPHHVGPSSKEYMAEAYTILNHITTLTRMLASIRRPYLNVDSGSSMLMGQKTPRAIDLGGSSSSESWAGVRHLSNEERDQIDLQARVILSRCADRVKQMEALEEARVKAASAKSNPLLRLLPSRLLEDASTAASEFLAAHNSSVTWYLNRRLAEASQSQKEMQEERIKRQLERAKTLGSGAARDAVGLGQNDAWMFVGGEPTASSTSTSRAGPSKATSTSYIPAPIESDLESDDEELDLTPAQIQQFESENANILRSMQDVLQSVQLAESRLLDISALQMELVAHLTRQTEITEQLYDDAVATSAKVEGGNQQLKEARRRQSDSRLYILVFLIGASFALLFLHAY